MQLVQRLVQKGILSESDLSRVADAQVAAPTRPGHELLIERGLAKEADVLAALAEELGLEPAALANGTVEPETLAARRLTLVHRRALLPLSRQNATLIVATGDPFDVNALDELQSLTGLVVQPVLPSPREIARLIKTDFG